MKDLVTIAIGDGYGSFVEFELEYHHSIQKGNSCVNAPRALTDCSHSAEGSCVALSVSFLMCAIRGRQGHGELTLLFQVIPLSWSFSPYYSSYNSPSYSSSLSLSLLSTYSPAYLSSYLTSLLCNMDTTETTTLCSSVTLWNRYYCI